MKNTKGFFNEKREINEKVVKYLYIKTVICSVCKKQYILPDGFEIEKDEIDDKYLIKKAENEFKIKKLQKKFEETGNCLNCKDVKFVFYKFYEGRYR